MSKSTVANKGRTGWGKRTMGKQGKRNLGILPETQDGKVWSDTDLAYLDSLPCETSRQRRFKRRLIATWRRQSGSTSIAYGNNPDEYQPIADMADTGITEKRTYTLNGIKVKVSVTVLEERISHKVHSTRMQRNRRTYATNLEKR